MGTSFWYDQTYLHINPVIDSYHLINKVVHALQSLTSNTSTHPDQNDQDQVNQQNNMQIITGVSSNGLYKVSWIDSCFNIRAAMFAVWGNKEHQTLKQIW